MNTEKTLVPALETGARPAQNLRPPATPPKPELDSGGTSYAAIDAYVEEEIRRLKIPGAALAVVEGDRIVHVRGFGRARPGGETPLPQTPFFIGSLTKSFTALAVMQLVEAGKIELDAPVQRYLPWFRVADPVASAAMTVRHLLNQTSGVPASSGEIVLADCDPRPGAAERQARALATLVPAGPPGAAFDYSNSNYQLLGLIVEAAAGEPYPGYVQAHVFGPLGMRHSFGREAAARQDGVAVGHRYWFAIPFAAPGMPMPEGALAGGGLCSSAEDLARYLLAHLNGGRYEDARILSSAGVAELHRPAVEFTAYGLTMQYGMGWFVDKIGQTRFVWHGGTLPHFGAYMALLPEQKRGVVLLFNACHHWFNPVLTGIGMGVTARLAGERPATVPIVRMIPWLLRAQLLVPVLQLAGVAATLRQLRRWRREPEHRPSGGRRRALALLLPLIPDLLVALSLKPLLSRRRGYLKLYMPDFSWTAMLCGSFALLWGLLRTGVVLQALRGTSSFPLRR